MPALRSPIRSPFKQVLRTAFDCADGAASAPSGPAALLMETGSYILAEDGTKLLIDYPATGLIVCDGNSMTMGNGVPAGQDYPAQLAAMIDTGATTWTVSNFGVGGQTTTDMTTDAAAQVASLWAAAGQAKVLIPWEAFNDIFNTSPTGATAFSRMQTYITTALGGRTDVVVIPITCPDKQTYTAGQRTAKDDYNVLLKAAYPNTIDLAAIDSRFEYPEDPNDVYDGHPTVTGYSIIAKAVTDKLITLGLVASGAYNVADTPTVDLTPGIYATWQTVTASGGTNIKVMSTTDSSLAQSFARPIPIVDTCALTVTNYQVGKYPKTTTFAYTITQAFTASTLFTTGLQARYAKGAASGASWPDSSGNSRNFTLSGSPVINGDGTVVFDGVDDKAVSTTFTFNQPSAIYMRVKLTSHNSNRTLVDSNATGFRAVKELSTGDLYLYCGSGNAAHNTQFTDGLWKSGAFVFDAANSLIQCDFAAPTTGNPTNYAGVGITYGTDGNSSTLWSASTLAELLAYSTSSHSQTERDALAMYLKRLI